MFVPHQAAKSPRLGMPDEASRTAMTKNVPSVPRTLAEFSQWQRSCRSTLKIRIFSPRASSRQISELPILIDEDLAICPSISAFFRVLKVVASKTKRHTFGLTGVSAYHNLALRGSTSDETSLLSRRSPLSSPWRSRVWRAAISLRGRHLRNIAAEER